MEGVSGSTHFCISSSFVTFAYYISNKCLVIVLMSLYDLWILSCEEGCEITARELEKNYTVLFLKAEIIPNV